MCNVKQVEHRLEHAQNIIDTAEAHCEDDGDSQALMKAFGLLEASIFDLQDLREELQNDGEQPGTASQ